MLHLDAGRRRLQALETGLIKLLICFAGSLLLCLPATSETLSDRGWQAFPRRVSVLKESFAGNFERTVVKTDYFIFQKQVVINNPIQTNGGDVLIVADELVLNAPIDTRVYMRMIPDYWVAASPGQDGVDFSSLGEAVGLVAPEGLYAFDSLYLWRESYDPAKKIFVYGVAERPHLMIEPGSATPVTKVTELPQLPSGQVPLASWKEYDRRYDSKRPTDGTNAPDAEVIWPAVKSGAIRIYANKVSLCGQCKTSLAGVRTLEEIITIPYTKPDPFDEDKRAVFLQASGLKGGRGAPGSMYSSEVGNLAGMAGGLSGAPGRGGDAGAIELHYVNHDPTEDEKSLFRVAAAADRGVPAQSHRQRTPSLTQIRKLPTRTAFSDEVAVPNLESLFGAPGSISLYSHDTDDAIRGIQALLLQAELSGNYSVELLVRKPDLFSISPVSALQFFLAQELVRLQSDLLSSLEHAVTSSPTSSIQYSPFFASLSCGKNAHLALPDKQQEYLAKLCDLRAVAARDPATSYLLRTGGVYWDIPDANSRLLHQQIITEVNRTQQLVHDVIAELKDVHELIYDSISDAQREHLKSAIARLQAARKALEDAYEEASNSVPGMADAITSIAKAGKGIADGVAAIYASNWIERVISL